MTCLLDWWYLNLSLTWYPYTIETLREPVNIISDSLSRYFHISDQSLNNNSNTILPPQTSASFHIKLLPRYIISWMLSLASSLTWPKESTKPLRPSSLATGTYGARSLNTQASRTNSWEQSHKETKQSWWCHQWHWCNEISLEKKVNSKCSIEQLNPLYPMYLHPSRRTFGVTQP